MQGVAHVHIIVHCVYAASTWLGNKEAPTSHGRVWGLPCVFSWPAWQGGSG